MPSQNKKLIIQPLFKRWMDRTKPDGELDVFAQEHVAVRVALSDLKRGGSIRSSISLATSIELTSVAAERAMWAALGEMRAEDLDRTSRRFYRNEEYDAATASNPDLTNDKVKPAIKVEAEFRELQTLTAEIALHISVFKRRFDELKNTRKIEPYLSNSVLPAAQLALARQMLVEQMAKVDPKVFQDISNLFEALMPRHEVIGNGHPLRTFERRFVLELIPLWIQLTGKLPRHRDQHFIDLVNACYRVFAYDPDELEQEITPLVRPNPVPLFKWETQLDWALPQFRKTSPYFEGGFSDDDKGNS